MNRPVLVFLAVILLFGCVVLAYLLVDRSISLTYSNQSAETAMRLANDWQSLIEREWQGMPKDVVYRKLKEHANRISPAKPVIKIDGNIIWYDEVKFIFTEGKLSRIEN